MKKIAVFASGAGSNLKALVDSQKRGDLHVEFVIVVGNNSGAGAFKIAQSNKIETLHISPSHFENIDDYTKTVIAALETRGIELIVLAGYMKMIPLDFIEYYENRIINIHPALLPAFGGQGMYGMNIHRAVIGAGVKIAGVTVHFVNGEYDKGAIIYQEAIAVFDEDTPETLSNRILELEHNTFWRAVKGIVDGTFTLKNGKVFGKISSL